MPVNKRKLQGQFVMVPLELIKDKRIKSNALRLLIHCLSNDPTWIFQKGKTAEEFFGEITKSNLRSLEGYIKQLKDAGYATGEFQHGDLTFYNFSVLPQNTGETANRQDETIGHPAGSDVPDYEQGERVLELFKQICGKELPFPSQLTPEHYQLINDRQNDLEKIGSDWERHFKEVVTTDYLMGKVKVKGKNKWKANFDWLLGPDNFRKVQDGYYSTTSQTSAKSSDFDVEEYNNSWNN